MLKEKVLQAVKCLNKEGLHKVDVGIILGTGLAQLGEAIENPIFVDYTKIENFPLSTVESHTGRLIYGDLGGKKVVAMQGRFHYYEGYEGDSITFGVRVMKELGVQTLVVSNAGGGLNPGFAPGDIMQIEDHVNFLGFNPLRGENEDEWGPRFPDMSEPYDKKLSKLAHEVALDLGLDLKKGVYLPVAGPNLETRAEYRMVRDMGADVVGMSTVPEVIVARHMNIPVLAVSVVTDMCLPDNLKEATLEEILKVAAVAEPKLTAIVKEVINRL